MGLDLETEYRVREASAAAKSKVKKKAKRRLRYTNGKATEEMAEIMRESLTKLSQSPKAKAHKAMIKCVEQLHVDSDKRLAFLDQLMRSEEAGLHAHLQTLEVAQGSDSDAIRTLVLRKKPDGNATRSHDRRHVRLQPYPVPGPHRPPRELVRIVE